MKRKIGDRINRQEIEKQRTGKKQENQRTTVRKLIIGKQAER